MDEYETLRQPLERLMQEVGYFIARERIGFQSEKVASKSFNQLVSYVDREAEKKLVKGLKSLCPEAGFLTEEQTTEQRMHGLHWVIDPLDGTTNFIHGVPVYSISVALADGNTLLLGSVYEVNRDEMFTAAKGKGATLNGRPIQVNTCDQLEHTLMATGFPYYDFDGLKSYLEVLKSLMQTTRGLRRLGSAAVDLAYVACGRFDGFFELSLNPWDVAAGCLLVQEAGGKVTDFQAGDNFLHGRSIIAASAAVHPKLLQIIAASFHTK